MTGTAMVRDKPVKPFPVSVKGVVVHDGRVALLKNERDEWELPGGKLELGETPESCVMREIKEELGLEVEVGPLLDAWLYHIREDVDVFIVTYGCRVTSYAGFIRSHEHKDIGLFEIENVEELTMPQGYKNSIRTWSKRLTATR